ncbi:Sporulation kinase E [Streptomyces sp. S4.7]|nr:Sporulation kinase E [Streptomyces sp. S4.7]
MANPTILTVDDDPAVSRAVARDIRTWLENKRLMVEIADTGVGIAKDVRPRIFEPFFTTKQVGEGTGLGLDISYRIVVNKHHGDLKVTSRPGDTRFQVCLPIEEEAVGPAAGESDGRGDGQPSS